MFHTTHTHAHTQRRKGRIEHVFRKERCSTILSLSTTKKKICELGVSVCVEIFQFKDKINGCFARDLTFRLGTSKKTIRDFFFPKREKI